MELSSQLGIYAYDAYLIACAVNQKSVLLSLDGGLCEQAKKVGVQVLKIEP